MSFEQWRAEYVNKHGVPPREVDAWNAGKAAERERLPDMIRQALLDTAADGDGEYAAQEADRLTERLLQGLGA
jgi:hypothetical protein